MHIVKKENYFASVAYMRFFIPSLVAAVGMSLVITVDSITVGSMLGAEGLAALSLGDILIVFLDFINYSFSIGGSIRYAKELGSGEAQCALSTFNSTFFGALILSILLSVAGISGLNFLTDILGGANTSSAVLQGFQDYAGILFLFLPPYILKYVLYHFVNSNSPKYASTVLLAGNIIAFGFSVFFVIFCGFGVGGAALATGVASTITTILLLLNILSRKTLLSLRPTLVRWKLVFKVFCEGVSSSYVHLLNALVIAFTVWIVERIGGTSGLAVFNVVTTLLMLFRAIAESVNRALTPMISTFLSEKSYQECRYTLKLGVISGISVTALLGILLSVLSENIAACMGLSGQIVPLCQTAIYLISIAALPMVINQILEMYDQIIEKEKLTIIIIFLQGAVFLIPLSWLFSFFGIEYFWLCYLAAETATLLVQLLIALKKKSITYLPAHAVEMVSSFIINASERDFSRFLHPLEEAICKMELSKRQAYFLNLIVEEICIDIIQNAFSDNHADRQYLKLTIMRDDSQNFSIFVRDNAIHYNPFEESVGDDMAHDLSIKLIKDKADRFFYRRYEGFNSLILNVNSDTQADEKAL